MNILRPGANCMGIYAAEPTGLLVDAADYYRAFYQSALTARRYILMAGWQFDSEVPLLHGEERNRAETDVRLVHFLDTLCARNPELDIYLLAWDFSVIFAREREWFQDFIFNWSTNERVHFRFDNVYAPGATHHQKFVVIDGCLAFLGGMDICSSRWDDRCHEEDSPYRIDTQGKPYSSYHDIQSYHGGPVVAELVSLFQARWLRAEAGALDLPRPPFPLPCPEPEGAIPLPAARVALSQTRARVEEAGVPEALEIRRLFIDAIMAAEELIYMETQYFSSAALYWTLVSRMALPDRPRLQIVLMLPDRLPFTEEVFLGLPQVKMIRGLKQVAQRTGHSFAAYSSACTGPGKRKLTFIHSKLLMIDDRFLTIGSANATNRSLALDSELNVSWEAEAAAAGAELARAIRGVRGSLLAEHAGFFGHGREEEFSVIEGLIPLLDQLVNDPGSRLCLYDADPDLDNGTDWPEVLEPITRMVDPDKPVDREFIFESITDYASKSLSKGMLKLSELLVELAD